MLGHPIQWSLAAVKEDTGILYKASSPPLPSFLSTAQHHPLPSLASWDPSSFPPPTGRDGLGFQLVGAYNGIEIGIWLLENKVVPWVALFFGVLLYLLFFFIFLAVARG